jgi:peptide deformylase
MALRNIVMDGDPVLKKKCRPVTSFDDRLGQLLDDMRETLEEAQGYGLAGSQVGVLRRVFISVDERNAPFDENGDLPEDYQTEYLEFINPEILSQEGEVLQYEGCLSFPERTAAIRRPQKVTVRAFDRHGIPFTLEAEGMLARCICHESNHLDGVTILDLAEYFYEDVEHDEED